MYDKQPYLSCTGYFTFVQYDRSRIRIVKHKLSPYPFKGYGEICINANIMCIILEKGFRG